MLSLSGHAIKLDKLEYLGNSLTECFINDPDMKILQNRNSFSQNLLAISSH